MPDNLPELRDIHLPTEGVSMFPPAYGWYVILASFAAFILLFKLFQYLRLKSKKRYALNLLNQFPQNDIEAAAQMSLILRRICVLKYHEAAALFGDAWIKFLNDHSKKKLSPQAAVLLGDAPYISSKSNKFNAQDVAELRKFCIEWIGENL